MDGDPHHRRDGVRHPQIGFADDCPSQCSARPQGQFVVRRAHICEQLGILHDLLRLLRIGQK